MDQVSYYEIKNQLSLKSQQTPGAQDMVLTPGLYQSKIVNWRGTGSKINSDYEEF